MGKRCKQFTLLVVGLLSSYVQITWQTHYGCVVSMLSLDIIKVYNYVSHKRLFYILKKKDFLKWLTDCHEARNSGC